MLHMLKALKYKVWLCFEDVLVTHTTLAVYSVKLKCGDVITLGFALEE